MIKGVHIVRKKGATIRWYVYAWRGGPCVLKSQGPVKPKLGSTELRAIASALEARRTPDTTILRSLIREWRSEDPARPSSPEWERLSANTKKTWGSALNRIDDKWGDVPLNVFNDPRMTSKIVAWRDSRASTPRAADIGITVIRALLEFGRLRGRVLTNVAAKIPTLYRGGDRAEIIWTKDALEQFTTAAVEAGKRCAADALRLAATTGLRREDLITLTWQQVGEFAVAKKALKRSKGKRRWASIPRLPELDELLVELRERPRRGGVHTVLVDGDGNSWSPDRLTKAIALVRDVAGITHIDQETGERRKPHLHDARGTFATKLMTSSDLNDAEIADVMGWSPGEVGRIRRVYVDQTAIVVALGERIRRSAVNRNCKPA